MSLSKSTADLLEQLSSTLPSSEASASEPSKSITSESSIAATVANEDVAVSSETLCAEAMRALIDQRGLDVIGIELGKESAIADYYVIASGTSQRHVRGMADKVRDALSPLGENPISESGFEKCDWLVIDYGNLVVHIFYEPIRQYYRIEDFLRSKPRVSLSGELANQAERLRTGMIS